MLTCLKSFWRAFRSAATSLTASALSLWICMVRARLTLPLDGLLPPAAGGEGFGSDDERLPNGDEKDGALNDAKGDNEAEDGGGGGTMAVGALLVTVVRDGGGEAVDGGPAAASPSSPSPAEGRVMASLSHRITFIVCCARPARRPTTYGTRRKGAPRMKVEAQEQAG